MLNSTEIPFDTLVTPREKEVVRLLAKGFTCKEIALLLFISRHTVETHKRNLIEKLDARNTTSMVCKVLRIDLPTI